LFLHRHIRCLACLAIAALGLAGAAGCAQTSDRDAAAADEVYRVLAKMPDNTGGQAARGTRESDASTGAGGQAARGTPESDASTGTGGQAARGTPESDASTGTGGQAARGTLESDASAAAKAAAAAAPTGTAAAAPVPAPLPVEATGEIRLTLAQVLQRALAGNPDIQIAGFSPPEARQDITAAEAVFDPAFFGSGTAGRVNRPTQSVLDTGVTSQSNLTQETLSWQAGLKDKIPTGGTFAIYQANDYQDSNSEFVVPNPQYATRLTFELSQPILRGGGIAYNRAPILVATLNADIAGADFRKAVTDVIASVIAAYWQLAFDIEAVRVSQASEDLAADVLRREKARQALGVSSDVDLQRAAAAVALRQADTVRAENQARDSMDRLKMLMNAPDLPLSGEAHLVPAESPRFYLVSINRAEAIATALAHRPELERARNAIAINRIRADVAGQDRLPKLDATLRYIMNGLGKSFSEGIEQQDFRERVSWNAGIEFEVPLGNRAADSTYRKRRLEYEQSLVDLDRQTIQFTQEVNTAVRAVLISRKEVESTLQAVEASSRQVRGEQRRFDLGQTTSDELLRAQETRTGAQRDYLKALLNFNLGLVSLARAEGIMLESQGIEVLEPEPAGDLPRPLGLRAARAAKLPLGVQPVLPEAAKPASK
jgi:outer membrane protein